MTAPVELVMVAVVNLFFYILLIQKAETVGSVNTNRGIFIKETSITELEFKTGVTRAYEE